MNPRILPSAHRHGVTDSRMLHAYRNAFKTHTRGDMTILVGDDGSGRLLEVGVARADEGDVIVHAMSARQRYL